MIPPQEAVEAGAKAVWEGTGNGDWEDVPAMRQHDVREAALLVLVAAMPHLEAAVRAEAAAELEQEASDRSYDSNEMITETYLEAAKKVRR